MDSSTINSGFGLNHQIDESNTFNNLTANSGFDLNHRIDHQELNTYYNVTANSGFDPNHYVQEQITNRITVNSGLDLNHYVQEDNREAHAKKASKRINSSMRLQRPPAFRMFKNPNQETSPETKNKKEANDKDNNGHIAVTFTFRELALATRNFQEECLLGTGGFGSVYKGCLESGQLAAIKQLDRIGLQGNREFLVEVMMLSLLRHQNLVNLIGYCADGDQRLLVYEHMPLGSLDNHLLDLAPDQKPLSWHTRMKIAAGAAKGLVYLHDNANPPVIHRDLKSSNILLDEGFIPKLSDLGLAKLGPIGDKTYISSRVAGTLGYCAPEYARTGRLTFKSDVYSFGVVLLELITGRRAFDTRRPIKEQSLVSWARPLFEDQRRLPQMADPLLQGDFSIRSLYQALAVAAMCLQGEAALRPLISDVASALSFLSVAQADEGGSASLPVLSPPLLDKMSSDNKEKRDEDSSDEHQRAIVEAIEWDSNSIIENNRRCSWICCK